MNAQQRVEVIGRLNCALAEILAVVEVLPPGYPLRGELIDMATPLCTRILGLALGDLADELEQVADHVEGLS